MRRKLRIYKMSHFLCCTCLTCFVSHSLLSSLLFQCVCKTTAGRLVVHVAMLMETHFELETTFVANTAYFVLWDPLLYSYSVCRLHNKTVAIHLQVKVIYSACAWNIYWWQNGSVIWGNVNGTTETHYSDSCLQLKVAKTHVK